MSEDNKQKKRTKLMVYLIVFAGAIVLLFTGREVYINMLSLPLGDYDFLKINEKAPIFSGTYICSQAPNPAVLLSSNYKKIILYFYPKDNTPFCTMQAKSLRDNYDLLKQKNYEIIGVSTDCIASHKEFIKKYNLKFKLISDVSHTIHDKYGVWSQKSFFGKKYWSTSRITFIIVDGVIKSIIKNIKHRDHAKQILEEDKNFKY